MEGIDPHGIFILVKEDPAGSSVVHDLSIRVVSNIVTSVVTSVPIDVVYVH